MWLIWLGNWQPCLLGKYFRPIFISLYLSISKKRSLVELITRIVSLTFLLWSVRTQEVQTRTGVTDQKPRHRRTGGTKNSRLRSWKNREVMSLGGVVHPTDISSNFLSETNLWYFSFRQLSLLRMWTFSKMRNLSPMPVNRENVDINTECTGFETTYAVNREWRATFNEILTCCMTCLFVRDTIRFSSLLLSHKNILACSQETSYH